MGEIGQRGGVRRVFVVAAIVAGLAVLPYYIPGLERLRAWEPGSPIPFGRVLELRPFTARAPGGGEAGPEMSDQQLLETARGGAAEVEPPIARPVRGGESDLRIEPEAFAGMRRRIDDPAGTMEHFHRTLRATARREPDAMTRIAVYSDSLNASDRISSSLRRAMQDRFGDGGKGFVPIVPGWPYQVHQDVEWERSGGWRTEVVNTRGAEGDRYGLGGVLARNAGLGSRANFGADASAYRLFYQAWPEGGEVVLRVDDADEARVPTRAAAIDDRVYTLDVPSGEHELELRVEAGEARLYGVAIENDGPGVVVDGLMLVGAFTRVLSHFDREHWAGQIALRETDLLVFWLGGNDAASQTTMLDPERYVDAYASSIAAARSGRPHASCLVVAPLDSRDARRNRVRRLVEAQREVATKTGCAFFDAYAATGGAGTMTRWQRTSPRLAEADGKHLTNPGARVVGTLLHQALLRGYDDWLARAR
jgi:lysophospholipase L1-like esterase